MFKKILFVSVILFFCFAGSVYLKAQNALDSGSFKSMFSQRMSELEAKIDKLATNLSAAKLESNNQEILAKLDQILANQQTIFQELDVIKVRASLHK